MNPNQSTILIVQNTILQQPSTPPIQSYFRSQKPNHISYGYRCHRLGTSQSSQNARMPRFLACTAIYVLKMGPKTSQE